MCLLVLNCVSACACASARGYAHTGANAHRGQSVLSCLAWVLEKELASLVKTRRFLITEPYLQPVDANLLFVQYPY